MLSHNEPFLSEVLREDHEGVAVYVAPSKALVNQAGFASGSLSSFFIVLPVLVDKSFWQVSAEIYARFGSKIFPAHSKQELLPVCNASLLNRTFAAFMSLA